MVPEFKTHEKPRSDARDVLRLYRGSPEILFRDLRGLYASVIICLFPALVTPKVVESLFPLKP